MCHQISMSVALQASQCLSRMQPAPLRTQSFPVKHSVWYTAYLQQQQPLPEVTTPRVRGNEVRLQTGSVTPPAPCSLSRCGRRPQPCWPGQLSALASV